MFEISSLNPCYGYSCRWVLLIISRNAFTSPLSLLCGVILSTAFVYLVIECVATTQAIKLSCPLKKKKANHTDQLKLVAR